VVGVAVLAREVREPADLLRRCEAPMVAGGPLPAGPRRRAWRRAGGDDVRGAFVVDVEATDQGGSRGARWPPLQRLLARVVGHALRQAPRAARVGLVVGASAPEARELWGDRVGELAVDPSTSAGRLAHHLDLHGPVVGVDTACSSGLVALHLACEALRSGYCDQVVVASASAIVSPRRWRAIAALGALSPSHQSRPFHPDADGFVRGEGAAALVLTAAERIPAEQVWAWVAATGVNHDGRTAALSVPSPAAQERLVREVLASASADPADISCCHPHGAGTPLGDGVEVEALGAVFDGLRPRVMATKAAVGHTEAPSGLLGLAGLAAALRAGTAPGLPHVDPSPAGLPFEVKAGRLRGELGLVCAYGLSGTNAAAVVRAGRGPQPLALTRPQHTPWPSPSPTPRTPATAAVGPVRAAVAAALGVPAAEVALHEDLVDQGLDSVTSVQVADLLGEELGVSVRPTLALEAGTVVELARQLVPSPPPTEAPGPGGPRVAIVAMACELPRAHDPDELWERLVDGARTARPAPWLGGAMVCTMEDPLAVDVELLGMPDEVVAGMDPRLRWLLDLAHRVTAEAGLMSSERVGVFVGAGEGDAQLPPGPLRATQRLGVEQSFFAGQLAHQLGFDGPALTVNTACSSGLVALHLARDSVAAGRCDAAVVAAANLLSSRHDHEQLRAMGVVSPSGASVPFDSDADGLVRGEGAVVMVLIGASALRAGRRRPLAWVRGSAVGHDGGRAGLAAPSATAQQRVLRAAWADAGVRPSDLSFVEAHGTGTTVGDRVEAHALAEASGRAPVPISAAKAAVGHLEHAAGLVGVVAAVQALARGESPGVPGARPSAELAARVDPRRRRLGRGALAGVSSFGVSGTLAHVVLEGPPEAPRPAGDDGAARPRRPWRVLPLWCSRAADAGAARDALRQADRSPDDLMASLLRRRGPFVQVVVCRDEPGIDLLEPREVVEVGATPRVAWLCTGAGAWSPGMADALIDAEPVFAEAIAEARDVVEPILGPGLLARGDADIAWRQVDTAAVTLALARLLRSWGLRPDVVAGHSMGELTAAAVAGALTWPAALRAVAERRRRYRELPPGGAMIAVPVGEEEARRLAEAHGLWVAAVNHPESTVLAGPSAAVQVVSQQLQGCRPLPFDGAFHGRGAARAAEGFGAVVVAQGVRPASVPVVTALDGRRAVDRLLEPTHWSDQITQPVRWREAVRTLAADGVGLWVELGPGPLLLPAVARCPEASGAMVPTLRRDAPGPRVLMECLARHLELGVPVDPDGVMERHAGRVVAVPTRPRRRRHPRPAVGASPWGRPNESPGGHKLEGIRLLSPRAVPLSAATATVHSRPALAPRADEPVEAAVEIIAALGAAKHPVDVQVPGLLPYAGGADPVSGAVAAVARVAQRERGMGAVQLGGGPEPVATEVDGVPLGLRFAPVDAPAASIAGAWVVTGGLGALGRHVAKWLVHQGADRVVLLGRRGQDTPGASAWLATLPEGSVQVVAGDVATVEGVERALTAAGDHLKGVIHAAGVVDDAPLSSLDAERIRAVMRPKVVGARLLAQLTASRPEVRLVWFGSAVSWLGNEGQAAYAAANGALDALAVGLQASGRPATCIAWGPWSGGGLADTPALQQRFRDRGVRPLAPRSALEALGRALGTRQPLVLVVDVDWDRAARVWPDDPTVVAMSDPPVPSAHQVAERVAGRRIDPSRPLVEQGFDSLALLQLANELTRQGMEVSMAGVMAGGALDDLPGASPAPTDAQLVDETASPAWAVPVALGLTFLTGLAAGLLVAWVT